MNVRNTNRFRRLFSGLIFSPLIVAVVGCWDSSVGVDCPDDPDGAKWVWNGKVCSLRRDGFNWGVSSIAAATDGSDDIYAVGAFTHFENSAVKYIARLNNDASLDRGFVPGTDFFSPVIVVAATDGSGDVYVGGYLSFSNSIIRGITRLNLDGSVDPGFDTGSGVRREVSTIVATTDGSGDVYIDGPLRLQANGSVDTGFNPAFRAGHNSIALAADGSGDIYVSRDLPPFISRLNYDGSLDTGFDTGISGFDRAVTAIAAAIDGSGDIYVTGYFTEYNGTVTKGLVRLNDDGSIDTGFGVNSGVYQGWNFILPAEDGSGDIYVSASNSGKKKIVRLDHNGSIDAGFGSGSTGTNDNGTLSDAAFAPDGSGDIYVAGDFSRYDSAPAAMLVRLTEQGVLVR